MSLLAERLKTLNRMHELEREVAALRASEHEQWEAIERAAHPPAAFLMYDDEDPDRIPADAAAVASYVDLFGGPFEQLSKRFPKARRLSIATSDSGHAETLDIENGDASPSQFPDWAVHMRELKVAERPCAYANLSTMPEVLQAIANAKLPRAQLRLWVADWTGRPHIPAGYDACQYFGSDSQSDRSWCAGTFL